MASKSHLSHKFKIELRAKSDGEALEEFNQYQTWYHKYGIDTLLAERVLAKDKKKTGRRGRPINAVVSRPPTESKTTGLRLRPNRTIGLN